MSFHRVLTIVSGPALCGGCSERCADLLRCSGAEPPFKARGLGATAKECILKVNQVASLASSGHRNPLEGMPDTDGRAPVGVSDAEGGV